LAKVLFLGATLAARFAPILWVRGFTAMADFEIQPDLTLATAVSYAGNIFAGIDPVPCLSKEYLVVAVQGHITITMTDYHQKTKTS